jgi:hypothetical protein
MQRSGESAVLVLGFVPIPGTILTAFDLPFTDGPF